MPPIIKAIPVRLRYLFTLESACDGFAVAFVADSLFSSVLPRPERKMRAAMTIAAIMTIIRMISSGPGLIISSRFSFHKRDGWHVLRCSFLSCTNLTVSGSSVKLEPVFPAMSIRDTPISRV